MADGSDDGMTARNDTANNRDIADGDEVSRNYAALEPLYAEWARGEPGRLALVAGGALHGYYPTPAAAREAVQTLPETVGHALVATLWPLDGWRHPRFVVESYRRPGLAPPAGIEGTDPLTRDFLLAERLRHEAIDAGASPRATNGGDPAGTIHGGDPPSVAHFGEPAGAIRGDEPAGATIAGSPAAPYLLIKNGAVLARFRRVAQVRQAVDAAMPPLAPVLFTSLRPGRAGPFEVMVLQALTDRDRT